MPDNVEIKARVQDLPAVTAKARELSGTEGVLLQQEDTFFCCTNGRLKLRMFQDAPSELIFYNRPDQAGPKLSKYQTAEVSDPQKMKEVLGQAMGVRGVVKKIRYLFMVGQTRVHVDQVENLGDFMELEVQLQEGQSPEEGQAIAHDLMLRLGVREEDLLTCAYMDLLLNKS